jgi:outer membrane murein-binding lipoprotein Lpp
MSNENQSSKPPVEAEHFVPKELKLSPQLEMFLAAISCLGLVPSAVLLILALINGGSLVYNHSAGIAADDAQINQVSVEADMVNEKTRNLSQQIRALNAQTQDFNTFMAELNASLSQPSTKQP